MKQQINLYQPMFRNQRHLLSSVPMVQVLGAMLVGLVVVSGYAAWQVGRLHAEHERMLVERAAAERRLAQLEQKAPKRTASRRIADERERMERRLLMSRELLDTVTRRATQSAAGFAVFFEGLARQRIEGLWLTGFDISDSGRRLQIAGSALKPELIPRLVQRLSSESTFHGASFASLTIDRPEDSPRQVDFVLQTVPEEQ